VETEAAGRVLKRFDPAAGVLERMLIDHVISALFDEDKWQQRSIEAF
jgi:hypothetical protein